MKNHLSYVLALALVMPVSVIAAERGVGPGGLNQSVYVGLNAGMTLSAVESIMSSDIGTAEKANVAGVGVHVGYNLTPNIAVEAGYLMPVQSTTLAITGTDPFSVTSKQVYAVIKMTAHLSDALSLYSKTGIAYSSSKVANAPAGALDNFIASSLVFAGGVGAQYEFKNNIALGLEYLFFPGSYKVEFANPQKTNTIASNNVLQREYITVTLSYKFDV